jgi:molecular chaperone GrpE
VLADFRDWLGAAFSGETDGAGPPPGEGVDLHTLLGQFLALRHEVNLQTRAVRSQQEQNGETLRQLSQALEALCQAPTETAPDDRVRSLLKTLVDLCDALALGAREVKRGEEALGALLDHVGAGQETPRPAPRSFWARLFGGGEQQEAAREETRERAVRDREALSRVRQGLAALVTGYSMGLQRVERALAQQGLEVMPAVGQPFDPERMEVVEAVTGSGRPSGEVIEEVRRGYLYNGRIFRFAQVRVARG